VEEQIVAGLSAPHEGGRRLDRRCLSCRDPHAPSAPRVEIGFRRGSRQGRSRTWRKVKGDWDACNARSLAAEPIIRLILDGTVVRVRLDKKATSISLLVALGVRQDGQKVLLAIKNMGGESEAAWRALLDDLIQRGLKTPKLVIVDGAPGLENALAALWSDVPVQRCTVHKHRNLLAHAPERLHEEISNDYKDMIYAQTRQEIEASHMAGGGGTAASLVCPDRPGRFRRHLLQRRGSAEPCDLPAAQRIGDRPSTPVCGGDRDRLHHSHRDPGVRMILLWLILTPPIGGVLAGFAGRRNNAWRRWLSLVYLAIDLMLILMLWQSTTALRSPPTLHGSPRSIGPGSRNSASRFISASTA
jgi:Transposase, Mutator family